MQNNRKHCLVFDIYVCIYVRTYLGRDMASGIGSNACLVPITSSAVEPS